MEKKIYKSNDRKICGVCGGLAEFFGIDPTIVRLVYAILALTYGSGLLIYIIAAIIMDDKPDYVSRGWYKTIKAVHWGARSFFVSIEGGKKQIGEKNW